jgi:hypothetical protein
MCPHNRNRRLPHWTRCWWSRENAHPRTDFPDGYKVMSVESALVTAQRWTGQERWVLESTTDYVHLLLAYVNRTIERNGQLTRDVCSILADPALDLLSELQLLASDERYADYAQLLDDELADLPLNATGTRWWGTDDELHGVGPDLTDSPECGQSVDGDRVRQRSG